MKQNQRSAPKSSAGLAAGSGAFGRVLVAWLLLVGGSCAAPPAVGQTYEVRGEVVGARFEGAALRVKHEAIPGHMDAMTMDFKVKEPSALPPLRSGDKIRFRYTVTDDDSWIEKIELLPPNTQLDLAGIADDEGGHHH